MTTTRAPLTPTETHRAHLRELLDCAPALCDTGWASALAATPRSAYALTIALPHGSVTADGPEADAYWATLAATGVLATTSPDGSTVTWAPALGFAALLVHLELRARQTALVIGARGGWEAAVIAAHPTRPEVTVCEPTPAIGAEAATRLGAAFSSARVEIANARDRLPAGRWDHIVVTGTTGHVPDLWVQALCPGGRLLTSIGQALAVVDRNSEGPGATGRFVSLPAAFGPWNHPDRAGGPLLTERGAKGFDLFAFLPNPTCVESAIDPVRGSDRHSDIALGLSYGLHVAMGRPQLDRFALTLDSGRTLVTLVDMGGTPLRTWDLTPSARPNPPITRTARPATAPRPPIACEES
nr:hypothetical protein [Streptomyces sp. SID3343]